MARFNSNLVSLMKMKDNSAIFSKVRPMNVAAKTSKVVSLANELEKTVLKLTNLGGY